MCDFIFHPDPPLPDWSAQHLLAIEICTLIPRCRWASYGDLARAHNYIVRQRGLGFKKQSGFTFARLIDDHDHRENGILSEWRSPWHRIRDEEGKCLRKYHGVVGSSRSTTGAPCGHERSRCP